ncbi:CHAT tetratricopeptide domain-containing protein [Fusarium mundagurra]|uniref:CHAT tetratricopeptide domain-containing protein n=1 Tax=Fusarium mundagurra TaxID=1567541 RepID=A0A8H5XLX9_9HYPO|nr:CHAT tetratricopeptide domain-containing protein [Fusarium mundagurra]
MDYATLSQFLGGTIFSEEYRGNLSEIECRCAEPAIIPPGSTSGEDRHFATLLRAVHLIFTGNLSEAQSRLESLLEEDGIGTQFAARCHDYLFYLVCVKRLPPVLRFHSTIDNSASLLMDAELHLGERIKELECRRQDLSVMGQLESTLTGHLLTFNTSLHISFATHPEHPPNFVTGRQIPLNPFTGGISDICARLGLRSTKLYLDRLAVELHLARGLTESQSMLEGLRAAYEAASDFCGVANCLLIKADGVVSRPFTSPLAMGLIVLLRGEGWCNDTWDAAEPAFLLRDDRQAQDLYDQASFFFEAANCPRGKAAILLRRGCIQHAVALSASRTDTKALKAFDEAGRYFSQAGVLFEGDIVNSMLVRCHQLLLAISTRGVVEVGSIMELASDPFNAAKDLGQCAHGTGNVGAAQFIGTLILRFGRWRFVCDRDVKLALVCCACARAFFAAARDSYLELQALLAHASLLHQSGDIARAEIKITEGRGPGGLLASVLERIAMVCDESENTSALQALRFNTLKSFDIVASRIYQATGNSAMLVEWISERDRLTPLGTRNHKQEMEHLFDRFTQMALEPELGQSPSRRDDVVSRIVSPLISQEQLLADYNNTMRLVYAALDKADVEAWQDLLRKFVWRCDHAAQPSLPSDQIAIFKLIALSQLDALDEARAILPAALPRDFTVPMSHTAAQDRLEQLMETYAPPDVALWRRKQKLDAADRAISYCVLAQDWACGAEVLSRAAAALPEFNRPHSLPCSSNSWLTLTFVAMIYEHIEQLSKALEWYLCALHQLEDLRNAADIEARRGCHSSIHSGELFNGLARICLAFEGSPAKSRPGLPKQWDLPGLSWADQALIFIERGRSRVLLDLLVTRQNLDPKKVTEWAEWAYRTYEGRLLIDMAAQRGNDDGVMSYSEVTGRLGQRGGNAAIQNKEDVLGALSRLEQEDLAAGSMLSLTIAVPPAESLFKCIPQDTVVFEISSSRQGLIVLSITNKGVVARHQSCLTDIQLRSLVLNFSKIVRKSKGTAEEKENLDQIAAKISKEIVQPLKGTMDDKEVVVFAPSHAMQLFPCSALLLDGKPLFLHKVVYHIPSLSVLLHSSRRHTAAGVTDRSIIGVLASSAAAGANMSPREALMDRKAIPMIGPEAVMIADTFNTNPIDLAGCNTDKLRSIIAQSDIVHLATHGTAIFGSPWQSYLDTKPPFRVLDLAVLKACARLVVFGCCWSGAGSANTGNDIIGFAHATLASGAEAYIGSLWKASDIASMLLMVLFYRELARSLQGQRVRLAETWRNAQVALYNLDGASVRAMLVEAQGLWREKVQSEETPHLGLFKYSEGALNAFLRQYARDPTIVDLKHPAIWAPYILVGYGDAIFGELRPGSTAAMQESVDSGPDASTGIASSSRMSEMTPDK